MQILLIGNKGQVGREIEELAASKNIQIIGYDIDQLDITVLEQVQACFKRHSGDAIDVVINAAAYTAVDKAENEPEKAYAVNRDAVRNLAILCKEYDLPLMHISTDYVFSGQSTVPYRENDIPAPLSIYGKSKLAGDEALQAIWAKHIILRVSWVFGKYGNNFVKTILRLAQEKKILSIVGDQYGCPTAAADIARVLLEVAEKIITGKKLWGIYNYGCSPATTWYEFAKKIIEFGRNKCSLQLQQLNQITTAEYPTKAPRPQNSELAVGKIIKDYGIERKDWVDYLQKVVNEISV